MNLELRAWSMLWLTAVFRWRPLAVKVCLSMLPLLALPFALVLAWQTGALAGALLVSARLALTALALVLTVPFLFRSPHLYTAAGAALVPGLRRRLICLALLCWLIAASVPALLLDLSPRARWQVFIGMGIGLSGLCQAQGRRLIAGILMMQVPPQLMINWKLVMEVANASGIGTPALLACAMLLTLLTVTLSIRRLFPLRAEERLKLRAAQALRGATVAHWGQPREANRRGPFWRSYEQALRREAVRGAPPRRLLQHGLSPSLHWSMVFWPLLCVVAGALLVKACVWALDVEVLTTLVARLGWMPLSMIMWTQALATSGRMPGVMLAARGEQSLLRLAPAFGAGAALNGQLADVLLRSGAVSWVLRALTVLGLSALLGASAATLVAALCVCALALPWIALPLQRVGGGVTALSELGVVWLVLGVVLTMAMVTEIGLRVALLVWPFVLVCALLLTFGLGRYWLNALQASGAVLPGSQTV